MACTALVTSMGVAMHAMKASPTSRAAETVRLQLLQSQLWEHLGPGMDATAAQFEAAVAALSAVAATPGSTQSLAELAQMVVLTKLCCSHLLCTFQMLSTVIQTEGLVLCRPAWPIAPSVVCLSLRTLQTHSQLQTIRQQQQPLDYLIASFETQPEGALNAVLKTLLALAFEIKNVSPSVLATLPGAADMLLLPEFVSCLAIVLLVAVLGLNTGVDAAPAASSSRSIRSSRSGGRSSGQQRSRPERQQQTTLASSSGGGDGSSSSSSNSNSRQLDSMTPLSCSLFGVLGISKDNALQAATLARSMGLTAASSLTTWLTAYMTVVRHQVSHSENQ